jgi:hypothetical protein
VPLEARFPEPEAPDDTWAGEGEALAAWLRRSTLPLARDLRRFYNENLERLPAAAATSITGMLSRGLNRRAFFELLVGRFLQELGAELEYERATPRGSRPDYLARFAQNATYVEAVSPVWNEQAAADERRLAPLAALVKRSAPPGWIISIEHLPELGPNDSKQRLRRSVSELFAQLPDPASVEASESIALSASLQDRSWPDLRLRALPRPGTTGQFLGPGIGYVHDVPYRMRDVVRDKSAQLRGADHPAIVAIDGWWAGTDLDDFDVGLFGHGPGHWDGVFAERRTEPPNIAAVLAFVRVGEIGGDDPVLYEHPRFAGSLPPALTALARRCLEDDAIVSDPASTTDVLEPLNFVSRQP